MRFQTYFTRRKGAGAGTLLGADTAPAFAPPGGAAPQADKDNVCAFKVAGVGNAINRLAVGMRYEGAGAPIALNATVWAYDRLSQQWYKAATGTLTDGEISYFRIPSLADAPQTAANLSNPSAGGGEIMLVVADGATGDGVYHFVMGPDTAEF